jgi:hypothetical protein
MKIENFEKNGIIYNENDIENDEIENENSKYNKYSKLKLYNFDELPSPWLKSNKFILTGYRFLFYFF